MRASNLQVEVDTVVEPVWSKLMSGFEDANIYQTWAYGAVRWGESNLSHLILKRDGEAVAMAQLRIVRPTTLRLGIAYLRWGPVCHVSGQIMNTEVVHAIASALRKEYVENRGLYLEILPNAFQGSQRANAFQSAFERFADKSKLRPERYRTFLVDLTPSLEELRKKLNRKWRNKLNASERNSLEIIEGDGPEEYLTFTGLYTLMRKRKRFKTSVKIEEFGRMNKRLVQNQRMRSFICKHQGQPISGLVCSAMGNSAIYLLGASTESGMKLKASHLLQWSVIDWLKNKGIRYYDLGGIDPAANPGVYVFKRGLAGVDVAQMGALAACDSHLSMALARIGRILTRFRGD
ncbi:MAG: lipid II:glycine glycyltransferase FemX [Candidatus Acidiferrales bacterium]